MYIVRPLMTNARTCLYKPQTSDYFGVNPPMLEDCFYGNCVKKHIIYLPTTRTYFMNHEQKIYMVHKNYNFLNKNQKTDKEVFLKKTFFTPAKN